MMDYAKWHNNCAIICDMRVEFVGIRKYKMHHETNNTTSQSGLKDTGDSGGPVVKDPE